MIYMTKPLGKLVGLPTGKTTVNVSIHEKNYGDWIMTKTFPWQFTHRSKHYAAKPIWFCEYIVKRGIKLCKIDTEEQLEDIFTKGIIKGQIWVASEEVDGLVDIFSLFFCCHPLDKKYCVSIPPCRCTG